MKLNTDTEIYLIRHGETEWNLEKRFQGQQDSPLTENGKRQAQLLGGLLKDVVFDFLYTSDLQRAVHTAEILNEQLHIENIFRDPLLRERNFGIFHGMTRAEVESKFPEYGTRIWTGNADEGIPQGESRRDVHQRALQFLQKTVRLHQGKRILVVTHGGIVNAIIREVLQISLDVPRRFKLPNTGLNILTFEEPHWYLKTLGLLPRFSDGTVYDETV